MCGAFFLVADVFRCSPHCLSRCRQYTAVQKKLSESKFLVTRRVLFVCRSAPFRTYLQPTASFARKSLLRRSSTRNSRRRPPISIRYVFGGTSPLLLFLLSFHPLFPAVRFVLLVRMAFCAGRISLSVCLLPFAFVWPKLTPDAVCLWVRGWGGDLACFPIARIRSDPAVD